MKNKKGALELSVTAIVVLILAIVMLGLGLGFIRGMFGKVQTQVEQQIAAEAEPPAPSPTDLITLSRESMITHSGDKEVMKVSVYNNRADVEGTNPLSFVKPWVECDNILSITGGLQSANTKNIEQGKFATFNLLITIPSSPPDTHLCQMKVVKGGVDGTNTEIGGYSKDFTIKITE